MFSSKTKASIILLVTLALGILIGGLGSNYLKTQRIGRMAHMRHRDGFQHVLNQVLNPTEEQKIAIREVTDKYHEKFAKQLEANMLHMEASFDSMKADLKPILTEEQLRLFEKRFRYGKPGDGFGPPGKRNGRQRRPRPPRDTDTPGI